MGKNDTGGTLEALLHGAGKGVSFGLSDRLQALAGALGANSPEWMGGPGLGKDTKSFGDRYDEALTEARTEEDKMAREHPTAFTGGDIAGSVLSSLIIPGGAAANAEKTALQQVLQSSGNAARVGAAQAAGRSRKDVFGRDSEPGNILTPFLKDTLKGAGVSGFAGALIPGIGSAISKAPGAGLTAIEKDALARSADALAQSGKTGATVSEVPDRVLNTILDAAMRKQTQQAAAKAIAEKTPWLETAKNSLASAAGGLAGFGSHGLQGAALGAIAAPLAVQGGKAILRHGPEFLTSPAGSAAVGGMLPAINQETPPAPVTPQQQKRDEELDKFTFPTE